MAAPSLGLPGVLAYGVLGLPLAFAALPLYVHVPRLYADSLGMSLSVVGAVLLGARLLDAGVDPLLGGWSDRLRRRRLLIALALPLLAAGLWCLLRPPAAVTPLWLAAALAATYLGFSLASIAYQAWGAELGGDSTERTRLVASREGFGIAGVILAALLPLALADEPAPALAELARVFLPLLLIAALIALRLPEAAPSSARLPTAAPPDRLAVLGDAAFRRLLGVFVANGIAAALPGTLVLFYVADVLEAPAASGPLLALYFVAGVLGLPLWVALARRHGRLRPWRAAMGLAIASFAVTPFLGPGDVAAFAVVCLLSGLTLGADLALPAALLADLAERRSRAAGASRTGSYLGWWNLVAKLNLALAAGLALPLLDALGYRPGEGSGVAALAWAYGGLPLVFKLLAALLAWRWQELLEDTK